MPSPSADRSTSPAHPGADDEALRRIRTAARAPPRHAGRPAGRGRAGRRPDGGRDRRRRPRGRAGHTEAAVDLLRLAGQELIGVIGEIVDDDGTMARGERLHAF
ncbi:3,4-dihydroxy-2-butanone-4-phosphate synthase, partial [Pseudonocardia kujensis]|uniref:3,4-dihydroxy-2-butanone-4-phosphate synthase n=1 Tax=Pseudonocardia kujensis TaxID=1128675 RepID=UPI0027DF5671